MYQIQLFWERLFHIISNFSLMIIVSFKTLKDNSPLPKVLVPTPSAGKEVHSTSFTAPIITNA